MTDQESVVKCICEELRKYDGKYKHTHYNYLEYNNDQVHRFNLFTSNYVYFVKITGTNIRIDLCGIHHEDVSTSTFDLSDPDFMIKIVEWVKRTKKEFVPV